MARKLTTAQKRKRKEALGATRNIGVVLVVLAVIGFFYFKAVLSQHSLDEATLCPASPQSVTVLLVDVTDPMNLPQKQDFLNQLDSLVESVPRYGKLVIAKVDPVSERLLVPVITRCNPGSSHDVSEISGNPGKLEAMRREKFIAPLREAFDQLLQASSAPRSPILESMQSINLTELQRSNAEGNRRLIVASDLLQHTPDISFYRRLPDPDGLVKSEAFSRVRTDLRGTDVELWMLQRADSTNTQPRQLPDLWDKIIGAQGGRLVRVYTVSG
ncbi:hypothetical protein [Lysobacter soli]|uniref:hypothetical protein n=1 Tax=Lysobacter soli TaxID=453783 RepID=UPI00241068B9|nr:hypothetical protein [Lysobacter soli]MDG2518091.1 hypothetical protein [Lysobacter soli]